MGASVPVLEVAGLVVDHGPVRALDGVDIEVAAGEVLAVVGESGAGKSTLVRCLAGDLSPVAGSISVAGQRIRPQPAAAAAAGVAVVWQDPELCDNLDVAANVLLGAEPRLGFLSARSGHRRAERLLDDLGIVLPVSGRRVGGLTGGQRQLVAVARALHREPRLLVLDEPTASLGAAEQGQVERLVRQVRARGVAVVLVSHDAHQVLRMADRVAVLRGGRIAAELDGRAAHHDDVVAVLNGQAVEGSARRQLGRLQALAERLAAAGSEPGSTVALVLSTLVAALGPVRACVHVDDGSTLRLVAGSGLPDALAAALAELPRRGVAGPPGEALRDGRPVVDDLTGGWPAPVTKAMVVAGVGSAVCVPVDSRRGDTVLTVLREGSGRADRDEVELVALYAGYVAGALERERAERARQEAAAARRTSELQSRFLSRLSHELRTPLTAIQGYASSLMADDVAWDDATERRFLERISAESGRVARLVDDLLDTSAIESGTMRMHPDWTDLALVLDSARACLPLSSTTAVHVHVDAPLPPVWADHDRLEQVFVNLMGNAVGHNPEGTTVRVRAGLDGPAHVVVAVDDDGSRRRGAGAAPGAHTGSGLGLGIARGIVEAHGGRLVVGPGPDGYHATVTLPVEGAAVGHG